VEEIGAFEPGGDPAKRRRAESLAMLFLTRVHFDVALAVRDANADTTLDDCRVFGLVTLHAGAGDLVPPNQLAALAHDVSTGVLGLTPPFGGTFRASGCRLAGIGLDTAAIALLGAGKQWRNIHRSFQLADNVFVAAAPNQTVAGHVGAGGNRFDYSLSDPPSLMMLANTVTMTGNATPDGIGTAVVGVPGGANGGMAALAANVMAVNIV
jgi:hypothetical protein